MYLGRVLNEELLRISVKIPKKTLRRMIKGLCKSMGVTRIEDDALLVLGDELEKICRKVLKEASELASHARRKVIKVEDVLLVKIR